ncbi:MAG: diguanylate cyclase domain-containing protein [Synechococcus sp.]
MCPPSATGDPPPEEVPGLTLLPAPSMVPAEPFLLLPGDGLLLAGWSPAADPRPETLQLIYADRAAHELLGPTFTGAVGWPLGEVWPELPPTLAPLLPRLEAEGPFDLPVNWQGEEQRLRIFLTDNGVGVGILAAMGSPPGAPSSGPENLFGQRLELFERLLHAVRDVVLITTAEPFDRPGPVIVYANAALLAHTGYTSREVLGRSPRLFQGAGTNPILRSGMRQALLAWHSFEAELLNYRKDGSSYWVDLVIAPLADPSGWYTHWISVQRDVSAQHRSLEKLSDQVHQDPLTGLLNRRSLPVQLERALRRLEILPGRVVVMFIDLNRFKEVNDSHGHRCGDALLVAVAERLKASLRPEDVLLRYAGDEFVLLLDHCGSEEHALQTAWRLVSSVGQPVPFEDITLEPAISVGIAITSNPHQSGEQLIEWADRAMYRAKRPDQPPVALYDPLRDGADPA